MKKILFTLTALFLLSILAFPLTAAAVSYSFLQEHRQVRDKAVMQTGAILCLFHSGTPDVHKEIGVNDMLNVYRETTSCDLKEVGKIKVLSYTGENYIKAEVVNGEIKHDDIAKKRTITSCYIHGRQVPVVKNSFTGTAGDAKMPAGRGENPEEHTIMEYLNGRTQA